MNNPSTDMLEENIRFMVETVEPDLKFSNTLWNKIIQTSQEPELVPFYRQLFSKPAWNLTMALIVAAIAIIAIGPQNVAAAFNKLLSYLPGIGFVQNDNSTLYLPEPLSIQNNGITLVIDQAVIDTTNTVVTYHFENLPKKAGSEADACFYDRNELITSDGKTKLPIGGGVQGNIARLNLHQ